MKIEIPNIQQFYPGATISQLKYGHLPQEVASTFEEHTQSSQDADWQLKEFLWCGKVFHPYSDCTSYVALQKMIRDDYIEGVRNGEVIYIEDYIHGKNVGFGRVQRVLSDNGQLNYPTIEYIQNNNGFEARGYAYQRAILFNAICQEIYGLPLSSGIARSVEAEIFCQKALKKGYALLETIPGSKYDDVVYIANIHPHQIEGLLRR